MPKEIQSGYTFTTSGSASLEVLKVDGVDRDVFLRISGARNDAAYFRAEDLKQLRKFLKKLQRQLEQNDLDSLD